MEESKNEEDIRSEDLIPWEIYTAVYTNSDGDEKTYIFEAGEDIHKPYTKYVSLYHRDVGNGDVNRNTNNFGQKYRRSTYTERRILELSIQNKIYTEPVFTNAYEIY